MHKRAVKNAAARAATSSDSDGEPNRGKLRKARARRASYSSAEERERDVGASSDEENNRARSRATRATAKKRQSAHGKSSSSENSSDGRHKQAPTSGTDTPRGSSGAAALRSKLQNKLQRMWNAGKMKRAPLLEHATIDAIQSALQGADKKRVRAKLLELFARDDPDATGAVDTVRFVKNISKVGVHLARASEYDALVGCFVKGTSSRTGRGDDDDGDIDRSRRASKLVDYAAFLDFASNARDSAKLSTLVDVLSHRLSKYSDRHGLCDLLAELRALDRKQRQWIPSDTFAAFLADHERPALKLSSRDVAALTERFEYEYARDALGVDYEQFARWLQPALHIDVRALHRRVRELVKMAHERGGWDVHELFRAMDRNGDGDVSSTELKDALREMGLPLSDAQLRCLVDEYDTSGDGRVQLDEFVALFPSLAPPKGSAKGKDKTKDKVKRRGRTSGSSSDFDTEERSKTPASGARKSKNTRKNTFSWDIGKAFARKQSVKDATAASAKSRASGSVKQRADRRSSSSSSPDARSASSADKTRFEMKHKKRAPLSSSSSEPSSEPKTSRKSKRASTVSSTESEDAGARRSKKPLESGAASKRGARGVVTTDDEAKASSSTESRPTRGKQKNKKQTSSSPTKKVKAKAKSTTAHRRERQQSAVSVRSRRSATASRSPSKARHRLASSASARAPRHRSKSRSRPDRLARPRQRASSRRRHAEHDGSTSSAGESVGSSASSGLDMEQLRQLKRERRRQYNKGDHAEGTALSDALASGEASDDDGDDSDARVLSRSDCEYEKHLKRSLRRAFDFFDLDQSASIEKKELSHVLRALGHEFTTAELDAAMARADLDQNGQLDFREFVAFVKRALARKQFMLSQRREMEIRQAFQALDADGNGALDEHEFEHLVYKVLGVELSVEEQDALLDLVDTNGDGSISEHEFIALMKVVEDVHARGGTSRSRANVLDGLDGISRLAMKAMKKLVRGAPVDLERNLLMFFGVPTNFRPAISSAATCRALQANTLQHVLSFPSPQMIIALAQDPSAGSWDKRAAAAVSGSTALKPDVDALETPGIDAFALLQQAECAQSHAIVSLKRAVGVPKPFDTREDDVLKRCVHVCLFQEHESIASKRRRRRAGVSHQQQQHESAAAGVVIGNVHEIPVHWHAGEEDVWEFSKRATKEDKYKFLVRTGTVNDRLYLLVEFVVVLRMAARELQRTDRRQRRRRRPRTRGGDDDANDDDDDDVRAGDAREMVCCWCKVPVRTLLAKRADVFRSQLKLWGGTAHAPVDIEQDEILRRRTGWRALTSAFKAPAVPSVGIKSVPVERFSDSLQQCVRQMPPTLIAPWLALPVLAEYMALMKSMLASTASSSAGVMCEPALKLLPRIIDDHEALTIFRRVFDTEMAAMKTPADRQTKFQELVMRMWPSQIQWREQLPATLLEKLTTGSGAAGASTRNLLAPSGSAAATSTALQAAASNRGNLGASVAFTDTALPHRATLLQSSAQGKLRFQDVRVASAPFHVREVAFERVV